MAKRRYVTLGRPEEGWDRQRAEAELRHTVADVERGIWRPPQPDPVPEQPREIPTLWEFSSNWLVVASTAELRPRTIEGATSGR